MALDPSIALGVRPLQVPDPMAQLAQVSQIQASQRQNEAAQRQNEIAQIQLEQLKQDRLEMQNFQSQLEKSGGNPDLDLLAKTMLKSPKYFEKGVELTKKLKEQADFERVGKSLYPELFGAAPAAAPTAAPALSMMRQPVAAPAAPTQDMLGTGMYGMQLTNALAPNVPQAASVNALAPTAAPTGKTADQLRREIIMFSQSGDPRAKAMADMLKAQLTEVSKTAPDATLMKQLGYPLTKAGYQAFRDAQRPDRLLTAEEEAQKIRVALASRPPAQPVQPVAPTITQIVDPTNPNQMIAVDARRYQGGGAGSPGVIGVGGKEPGAALRTNKVEEGKSQLANDLDNLRSSFAELDRLRAIPSTERNVVSNLMSATAASGVGQAMGRAGGSPEQVERDVINSARQRLVSSIKNATGMSSKSLDSNVELQTMLRSISDPGQSVEAAMRIIDDIEAAYVKGSGTLPKRSQPGAGAQGTGGFKYLGKESNK